MNTDIEAFPLQWPIGWPHTDPARRQRSRFDTSLAAARDGIVEELRLMGSPRHRVVISTNVELRRDGLPYANRRQPDDPGAAVYFLRGGKQQCIACDRWDRVEDNLQAIRKTIDALRGLERWGSSAIVDAAFQGFAALPSGDDATGWWTVLGVARDAPLDIVKQTYRARLMATHPDRGGDVEQYHRLQTAWKQFIAERGPGS